MTRQTNQDKRAKVRFGRLTLIVFFLLSLLPVTSQAQSDPILVYRMTHDLLATDDVFTAEIYDDGRALVHFPHYMKKAGDYSVQLSPAEVQQIRLLLEHPLVQGFDREAIAADKKQIDDQSSELFFISDDTYSEFEINVQSPPGPGKRIRWANLNVDTKRYPGIGVFRKLADIETGLLELDQHPTSERID